MNKFSCSRTPLWRLSSTRISGVSSRLLPRLCTNFHSSPPQVQRRTWVDCFPTNVRPYLYLTRIDKPIGTLLLFYPCGTRCALHAVVR
jgi:hypothetical protein